jgi:ABC-type branched-subunit amino acid transport system substrate-binding protein
MPGYRLSRRRLLRLGGAALAASLLGPSAAGASRRAWLRLGVVVPLMREPPPSGTVDLRAAGEAARMGALLAGEEYDLGVEETRTHELDVLLASAPSDGAALRAAKRLIAVDEVNALIGGFGEGQATALAEVAATNRIPFLNIGSASDALRENDSGYTFHVEASSATYLAALVCWATDSGFRRWFLVQSDSSEGRALSTRARSLLADHEVTTGTVESDARNLGETLQAITSYEPDIVLLLLDPLAQLDFLGQYRPDCLAAEVIGIPSPLTQTRQFLAAYGEFAASAGSGYQLTLWEPTIGVPAAAELDKRFTARWGLPMDPSGWAAYQSIGILLEAALTICTTNGSELARYLARPGSSFDIGKGSKVSFGRSDHQLRQDLYLVQVDGEAQQRTESLRLVAELPVGCKRQVGGQ